MTMRGWIQAAARDMDASRSLIMVLLAVPVILPLVTIAAALWNRPLFNMITGEDAVGEWLQVIAWVGAIVFTARLVMRLSQRRDFLFVALYGTLLVAMIFIVLEEVSYGQRIFGFATPEELLAINRQGESNVHNINGVQTMFSWAMFIVGAYGTMLPLLAIRQWGGYSRWPLFVQRLVPHWVLLPHFLLLLVWRTYRNLFEPVQEFYFTISRFGEVTELVLALAFLTFCWHQWRMSARAPTMMSRMSMPGGAV